MVTGQSFSFWDQITHTWNHKLLTILLSTNSGSTHTVPKVNDRNGFIQDHTVIPIPGEWPNIMVNKYLRNGSKPHSKINMLTQNTPPFKAQHWIVLFNTFDSLKIHYNVLIKIYTYIKYKILKFWYILLYNLTIYLKWLKCFGGWGMTAMSFPWLSVLFKGGLDNFSLIRLSI